MVSPVVNEARVVVAKQPETPANNIKPTGGLPLPAPVEQSKQTQADIKAMSAKV